VASESEEELPQEQPAVVTKEQPILNVWTQDEDALLIDNYEQFKELPKRERFEYLATLIANKSPKECYRRAKILKIKSLGKDGARQISQQLFLEKKGDITRAKVAYALKQFLSVKGKSAGPYVNYLHKIAGDFQRFKQEEENLLLFGSQQDIEDFHRGKVEFTVVPLAREDFDMLKDHDFLRLLDVFGVKHSPPGRYLRVIATKEQMAEDIEKLARMWAEVGESMDLELLEQFMTVKKGEAEQRYEEGRAKQKKKKKHSKEHDDDE
jgi:hypothetical protein